MTHIEAASRSSQGFFRLRGDGQMGTFEPLEFGVGKWRKDQFGDEGGTNCAYHCSRQNPQGRRILAFDIFLLRNNEPVARAHTMFVVSNASPSGELWAPDDELPTPMPETEGGDQNPSVRRRWLAMVGRCRVCCRLHAQTHLATAIRGRRGGDPQALSLSPAPAPWVASS
jgi:hypothetical protein